MRRLKNIKKERAMMSQTKIRDIERYIINMMTLRYDPLSQPSIRLRNWQDFLPHEGDKYEGKLVNLVRRGLEEKVVKRGYRKVGIALSGGVDSTFVLSQLREVLPDIEIVALCATFGDAYDETESAKRVAEIYRCTFKPIRISDPFIKLKDLIRIAEEPRWNLYFYYVLEEASKNCELILTGDGGDELFGGYTFRYAKFLSNLKSEDGWREKAVNYLNCHERDWVPDQVELFGKRMNFDWEAVYGLLRKNFENPLDPLDQVYLADFNGKLAFDWIPTNGKLSDHLGVECYAPLLKEDVINLATHMPNVHKFDRSSNIGKRILRASLEQRGLFVVNQKIGFGMDVIEIWKRSGKAWVDRYLFSDSVAIDQGIIDGGWLRRAYAMANSENSPRYITKLFSVLSLEVWLREFPIDI